MDTGPVVNGQSNYSGIKRAAPVFQPMRSKTKTVPCTYSTCDFSRASGELHVIARNCDWFVALL